MKIRFTAGSEVLRIADLLASDEALAPMSVAGALLVFDFADELTDAVASIKTMDDRLGELLLDADEANISAITALKRTLPEIEREVRGHFQVRDAIASEPTVTDTGSQPTSTGDAATSTAPTQSSVTQNEEIVDEPSQPEPQQQPRRRRG